MGPGLEDAVVRNPLKEYQSELGEFTYAALRSMMIATCRIEIRQNFARHRARTRP